MKRLRKAVILAAGIGSRLRNIHTNKPKGFIQFGEKPIIEESIAKLILLGINEIIIVTGYQNQYYEDLKLKYPFLKTIKNEIFETTGSMYSLWTAKELIGDDFLLLESDLIYELEALQTLINSKYENTILLSGRTNAGDEVYVGIDGNRIVNMSKSIDDIKIMGGELVGISKISFNLYKLMIETAEAHFSKKANYHYEDCLTDVSSKSVINYELIEDLAWLEIDDENHYTRAQELIYPRILDRDKNFQIIKRLGRNILLNPGPATTSDSVKYSMVVEDICPRELEFGELVEGIRSDLVKVVHGEETHVAILFASSGTGGLEACITSVIPDDKSVLVINNGAYGRRIQQICEGFSINQVKYDIPYGDPIDLKRLEELIIDNRQDLSHIAFIHHETTVGILNPIDKIAEIAQKYNLEIIVDTISSYAGIPIDVKKDNIHYIVASANKCIQGMAGLSFVICKKESLERTANYKRRNFYFNLYDNWTFFNKSKQMQFTPPVQIFYALRQAINEYFIETEEGRAKRYADMYEVLKEGLIRLGFKFLVDEKHHSKLLTAIIEPEDPNYNFIEMHDYLLARGFTIYPGKGAKKNTFRLSNLGQIYVEDINQFLIALEQYLIDYKIKLK